MFCIFSLFLLDLCAKKKPKWTFRCLSKYSAYSDTLQAHLAKTGAMLEKTLDLPEYLKQCDIVCLSVSLVWLLAKHLKPITSLLELAKLLSGKWSHWWGCWYTALSQNISFLISLDLHVIINDPNLWECTDQVSELLIIINSDNKYFVKNRVWMQLYKMCHFGLEPPVGSWEGYQMPWELHFAHFWCNAKQKGGTSTFFGCVHILIFILNCQGNCLLAGAKLSAYLLDKCHINLAS